MAHGHSQESQHILSFAVTGATDSDTHTHTPRGGTVPILQGLQDPPQKHSKEIEVSSPPMRGASPSALDGETDHVSCSDVKEVCFHSISRLLGSSYVHCLTLSEKFEYESSFGEWNYFR